MKKAKPTIFVVSGDRASGEALRKIVETIATYPGVSCSPKDFKVKLAAVDDVRAVLIDRSTTDAEIAELADLGKNSI